MDEITCFEISPGSIHVFDCNQCDGQAFAFDAVALGAEGVAFVGTIRRCYTCEGDSNG